MRCSFFILPCITSDEMLDTVSATPASPSPPLYSTLVPSMVSDEPLSESWDVTHQSRSESFHSLGQKVHSVHISCFWAPLLPMAYMLHFFVLHVHVYAGS